MPIEFPCTQCNELLRTPDGTAGRQATCPECSAVVTIPEPSSVPAPAGVSPPPNSADSTNPYAAPSGQAEPNFDLGPRGLEPRPVSYDQLMSRTWSTMKANFVQMLLFGLILIALQIAGQIVAIPLGVLQTLGPNNPVFIGGMVVLQQLWGVLLNGCIFALSCRFIVLLLRGNAEPIQQMFQIWPFLFRSILLHLIFILVVVAILLVCALPAGAIYLVTREVVPTVIAGVFGALAYMVLSLFVFLRIGVSQFLIVEQNQSTLQAVREAELYLRGNSLAGALALFVTGILGTIASILTCGIGFLLFMPYVWLLLGVLYMSITGSWQPTMSPYQEQPFVPPAGGSSQMPST